MDIYRDYFTRENLVRSLEKAQFVPGMLGAMGLFETVPLTSTTFSIEENVVNGVRVLSPISRGGPRNRERLEKRKVHSFQTETYGDEGDVFADEVLNARGAGTAGVAEVLTDRRDRMVAKLRGTVDYTHEYLRMQCLLNPGTAELGSGGSDQVLAIDNDATKMRKGVFEKIIKPIEAAIDGLTYTGVDVLCSDGFWSDLIECKAIRETYLATAAAAELRGSTVMAFSFGDVNWRRVRGTSAVKITDNQARVVPRGVPGMFYQAFAPNDVLESVGTGALGQPYYMGSKEHKDSQGTKGWEISIQSHPKMVCGRPAAVFALKKS